MARIERVSITTSPRKKPLTTTVRGFLNVGAGEMNRTPDLLITNELLYRLSYTGNARDYSPDRISLRGGSP